MRFVLVPVVMIVVASLTLPTTAAPKPVTGTVTVGNLPLDRDGAVRVASPPARAPMTVELIDTPREHVEAYAFPLTVDTAGYSSIGLAIVTSPPGVDVVYTLNWSWGEDDAYGEVLDPRVTLPSGNMCHTGQLASVRQKLHCPAVGGRAQVVVSAGAGVVFTSVKLYLIP